MALASNGAMAAVPEANANVKAPTIKIPPSQMQVLGAGNSGISAVSIQNPNTATGAFNEITVNGGGNASCNFRVYTGGAQDVAYFDEINKTLPFSFNMVASNPGTFAVKAAGIPGDPKACKGQATAVLTIAAPNSNAPTR